MDFTWKRPRPDPSSPTTGPAPNFWKAYTPLYKKRWQVELFFRWIKRHLRINRFMGTSENAAKNQIWIAVAAYVLITIVKKELQLDVSLRFATDFLGVESESSRCQSQRLSYVSKESPPAWAN